MQELNKQLVDYIEGVILPQYDNFDKGHNREHIENVQKRSLEYFEKLNNPKLDINMVYAIASYHDIGCKIKREGHPFYSGQILRDDKNLKKWFSDDEIEVMAQACEDHSTSTGHEPRSVYGKIVSDADKDRDIDVCIMRGWDYIYFRQPDISLEEGAEDVRRELLRRFCDKDQGGEGLVKFYLQIDDNRAFLQEVREYCLDKEKLKNKLSSLLKKRCNNENNN